MSLHENDIQEGVLIVFRMVDKTWVSKKDGIVSRAIRSQFEASNNWILFKWNSNRLFFDTYTTGQERWTIPNYAFTQANTWYMLTLTFDGCQCPERKLVMPAPSQISLVAPCNFLVLYRLSRPVWHGSDHLRFLLILDSS